MVGMSGGPDHISISSWGYTDEDGEGDGVLYDDAIFRRFSVTKDDVRIGMILVPKDEDLTETFVRAIRAFGD